MNPALLLPLGLAALAAWLLPLLIHLVRRSERITTDFAALRWLRERPHPRHRLRWDEWPLLLLRLALLAVLALWLARPVDTGDERSQPWVAVVPGVDPAIVRAQADTRVHWLVPGFPEFAQTPRVGPLPLGSLLRELDATLPPHAALTVWVPERIGGLDAERPRLSRPVEWRVVPGGMPADAPAPAQEPFRLDVRYVPDREDAVRYLRAAALAWNPDGQASERVFAQAPVSTQTLPPRNERVLVWLAPGALPAHVRDWIAAGGTALLDADSAWPAGVGIERVALWRNDQGEVLAEGARVGQGRVVRFVRRLTPHALPALLEPTFPARLRALFASAPVAPAQAFANDQQPLSGGVPARPAPRDLRPWLALLVAAMFALERWMATRPRGADA